MTDMFDLETSMMDCWSVCDALDTVVKQIGDGKSDPTPDEIAIVLMGIKQLYKWRFEQLFGTFEEIIRERNTNA
tara:strand:+ start:281 stop:502 length:222 start_codon:yes stop_codon:yes gene_type:complete